MCVRDVSVALPRRAEGALRTALFLHITARQCRLDSFSFPSRPQERTIAWTVASSACIAHNVCYMLPPCSGLRSA